MDNRPLTKLETITGSITMITLFTLFIFLLAWASPKHTTQAAKKGTAAAMTIFQPLYIVVSEYTTTYFPNDYYVEEDIIKEAYITSEKEMLDFLADYELVKFESDNIVSTSTKKPGYARSFSQLSISFSRDLEQSEKALINSEILY
jgi:hypothetical protein